MSHDEDLNGLDRKIDIRGYFERILKERERTEVEREKRLDERFQAQKDAIGKAFDAQTEAIKKAETRLDGTLKGFPQEYARRLELEQMIAALDETSTVLAQKVVDSAKALADAQTASAERLSEVQDKTDERTDARFKKIENYQSRLGGVAIAAPILMSILTALIILQFNN